MTVRVNRPRPLTIPETNERPSLARPTVDVRMFGGWGPKF